MCSNLNIVYVIIVHVPDNHVIDVYVNAHVPCRNCVCSDVVQIMCTCVRARVPQPRPWRYVSCVRVEINRYVNRMHNLHIVSL